VIGLNVLGERLALDFFTAMVPVLQRLGVLDQEDQGEHEYWEVHGEVDGKHLRYGLGHCKAVSPDSAAGRKIQDLLWRYANAYHKMLAGWAGVESVRSLKRVDPQIDARARKVYRRDVTSNALT